MVSNQFVWNIRNVMMNRSQVVMKSNKAYFRIAVELEKREFVISSNKIALKSSEVVLTYC